MVNTMTRLVGGMAAVMVLLTAAPAGAQVITQRPGVLPGLADKVPALPPPPAGLNYVIGVDDVLTITVWREPDVSGDAVVRPDGKITMRVGDELMAAGLTTEELRLKVVEQLRKFYEEPIPAVQVQVKEVHSRNVYIEGQIVKPGVYPLRAGMTVSHLISTAGGLHEWANKREIMVISATLTDKNGQPLTHKVNYEDIQRGRNVGRNNIELRPGDQVIVR